MHELKTRPSTITPQQNSAGSNGVKCHPQTTDKVLSVARLVLRSYWHYDSPQSCPSVPLFLARADRKKVSFARKQNIGDQPNLRIGITESIGVSAGLDLLMGYHLLQDSPIIGARPVDKAPLDHCTAIHLISTSVFKGKVLTATHLGTISTVKRAAWTY